jgi:MiaB-like tRNA modifying enzyme
METRRVYAESYGCPANTFDLAVMLAQLEASGYRRTDHPERADVLLVNTCGVKRATEDRMLWRLASLQRLRKPLVVAGCLPRIDLSALEKVGAMTYLDPRSVEHVVEAVECTLAGETGRRFFSERPRDKLALPRKRLNPCIDVIQIAEGCRGACTFCCTRFARGALFSYPASSIVAAVARGVATGVKEFWLTAQDTGTYGLDRGATLAQLVTSLCRVEGDFQLRVGMMNPRALMGFVDRLIDAYQDRKIFKFLHLPLQSGDDAVLHRMNRPYRVDDFTAIVDRFRRGVPGLTVWTDVICGFPGEDDAAFRGTIAAVTATQPDVVNISQFFPRPGTPARTLRQLSNRVVKARSRAMTTLCREIAARRNRRWIGWRGEILVDERGKGASWVGRNFAYKPVVVHDATAALGQRRDVVVDTATATHLTAF